MSSNIADGALAAGELVRHLSGHVPGVRMLRDLALGLRMIALFFSLPSLRKRSIGFDLSLLHGIARAP